MNKIIPQNKTILDPCFVAQEKWELSKTQERVLSILLSDNFSNLLSEKARQRYVIKRLCDGRALNIRPDQIIDFRNLPYPDSYFNFVLFEPPYFVNDGSNSRAASKYGRLDKKTLLDDVRVGFSEAFRVLNPQGSLVLKWPEKDVTVGEIQKLAPSRPVNVYKTGRKIGTHWNLFLKEGDAA